MDWFAAPLEGVIVGGVPVGASNILLERMRGRRELSGRFLAERREAYAAFLGQADQILRIHTNFLEADRRHQQWQARMSDLSAGVQAFAAEPHLAAFLGDWSVDPTIEDPVESFRATFELVQPHLPKERSDHFRALLDEAGPLQGDFESLLDEQDALTADFVAARTTLNQAHTQVELCAGSTARAAADVLRATMTAAVTDRAAVISSIAKEREAFATAARRDLGAPR